MICGISSVMYGTNSYTKVYASGRSPIHTLAGTEKHSHEVKATIWSDATSYTENYYKNTGIQIYGTTNSGKTTTGASVNLDSSSFYVDFTGANSLYVPSKALEGICLTLSYSFEIFNSAGYRQWYASFSSNALEVQETPYTLTYDIYGNKSTKIDSDGLLTRNFTPGELGKRLVNLYGNDFTWKISRTYYWLTMNPKMTVYISTSTINGSLMIDTTNPTLSAVGNTDGRSIANGSYVNQLVKFTASDTNFSKIYYQSPNLSSFSSVSVKTYTSTAITGWWTVYSEDKVGNRSNEFKFYYDATKPVGSISSGGTTVASGSYVSKSFSYIVNDTGSGLKQIYYKSPVSGSYQTYASGTIIPATAGDGWYYFYAVDNAGNQSDTLKVYLETSAPLVEIYRNGSVAYSSTITKSETYDTGIYMNINDIMKITYESSSGNVTSNYNLNQNITIDKSYTASSYTITITTPTGITAKYIFHIVDEKPYITIGSKKYTNNETIYLKEDSYVNWYDDPSITNSDNTGVNIISDGDINSNEFIKYTASSGKKLTTSANTETKYVLTLNDRAGNESTFTIYIDKKPVDATWISKGDTIENGGYTNQPVYLEISERTATATYSKNGGEYQTYTSNQSLSEEGSYSIIVVDKAGNKSTFTVNIDYTAPTGKLYANYQEVQDGTVTNQKIYFSWDGDNTATVNGNEYVKNNVISEDGTYEFVLKDKAGNSNTYHIQIDTENPAYNKYQLDNNKDHTVAKWYNVEFDGKINSFASYESALEFASKKEFEKYVTKLELINVEDFTQYHLVATKGNPQDEVKVGSYYRYKSQANASNELYYFDTDLLNEVISHYAKNYISKVIYYDLNENEYGELAENMYDNLWNNDDIQAPCVNGFVFEEVDANEVYAKLVGSEEEKTKVEFDIPFEEQFDTTGLYEITEIDKAGNKSTFTVNIDYTAPTGKLYANYQEVQDGTVTNQKIYFSWDGDNTATVNGNEYVKNNVISEDGTYEFVLKDKAGNSNTYHIQIDTENPAYNKYQLDNNKDHTVAKWYNVEFDGKINSFASYESALEFASKKEFEKYVTKLELINVEDFTQYHLVATKGNPQDEVKVGSYYRYKSQANASNELYYFDTDLLNEVISHYAKNYISKVIYYDLNENEYGELAENMYDNLWNNDDIQAPCVNGFVFEEVDANEVYAKLVGSEEEKTKVEFDIPFEEQFDTTGLYEITEIDKAGNITTYYVFLDLSAPELVVDAEVFGTGSSSEMTITKDKTEEIGTYYYKSFNVKSIVDNDSWSMILIENDGVKTYYSNQDELPSLNVGGEYLITIYDRLGNSYSFTVYIVGNEATITFTPNQTLTEFDIDISLEQEFDTVVSLEIFKDGQKLEGVSTDVLHYTFSKDGEYKVVIRDNFGRTIERTYDFNKSLPNGSLSVDNGGRTTDEVVFTYDNEKYYAEITLNGENPTTDRDGEIRVSADGSYKIKLINISDEDNFNEYTFTIDNLAPNITLDGVNNHETTNKDVVVSWNDSDVVSSTYTINGGEDVTFENNTKFTEEGVYVITVVDDLGNSSTTTFTIDKSLDYDIYVNDLVTADVDRTNQEVVIVNNENLTLSVTRNGSEYEYEFGNPLTEEGVYLFKVSDDYGNTISFQIIIDKSVDAYVTTGDGMISNDGVTITSGEKVNVIVTKDGQEYQYTIGEEITEEGSYKVIIYDTYGNEKTIYFQIVNGTKTKLDYTLGSNVEIVSVTKDGEIIEWNSNYFNFTEDGTYVVKAKVNGVEYTFELSLDTTAPEITLNGIENGETANVTVTITDMTEDGTIEVYKDGEIIEYNLGDEIKDYGSYEVKVTDGLGNTRTYSFTLEYQMNGWAIALIIIGGVIIAGLVVLIILKKRRVFKK